MITNNTGLTVSGVVRSQQGLPEIGDAEGSTPTGGAGTPSGPRGKRDEVRRESDEEHSIH